MSLEAKVKELEKELNKKDLADSKKRDKIFKKWWDNLDDNEKFELVSNIKNRLSLEALIMMETCKVSSQRC